MRNRRSWLNIKAILIFLFIVVIIALPTNDTGRKLFRFGMLIVFVVSFILDLNDYRRRKND